jgi:predicted AAA+ superfamily ATPase
MQIRDEVKKRFPKNTIIYINKEDYKFDSLKDYRDLMAYLEPTISKGKKVHLFIDEIQEIEQFELAIRSLQLNDNFDIYCTGSNASLLSSELATFLAGRYVEFRIYSLNYVEFLYFHKLKDSTESFLHYLKIGGMPHLLHLPNNTEVIREYHKNIYDSIILRDIVSRHGLRNVTLLNNLTRFLADSVGSLFSANSISVYLKSQKLQVQTKTIIEYISFLEDVFFIDRVKRIEIEGKKIFEIGEKLFFEDLGIRNNLIPFKIQDLNKLLENVVYHHLKTNSYEIFVGQMGTREIDFVAIKNDSKIYIQVALTLMEEKTMEREFGNLEKIKDNYPKFVISMDDLPSSNQNGIQHWNIRKFLMEFD